MVALVADFLSALNNLFEISRTDALNAKSVQIVRSRIDSKGLRIIPVGFSIIKTR